MQELTNEEFFLFYNFYADKTSIEVCICSYWLQLFDGLALSLKMEAIF